MSLRFLALVLLASCRQKAATEDPVQSIRADDIRKHQTFLASDECEGRGAGSEGGKKASAYLADQVKALGFKPAGAEGTYFQPFGEGRRNVAAFWPGKEGDEYVVVGRTTITWARRATRSSRARTTTRAAPRRCWTSRRRWGRRSSVAGCW